MSKPIIINVRSLGDIIEIQGLKIQLPKQPKKKDILFSNKKRAEQRWIREDMPKGLSRDTAVDYYDYIEEEFKRRREGLWFMNNGEPTYITGSHYMFISFCYFFSWLPKCQLYPWIA